MVTKVKEKRMKIKMTLPVSCVSMSVLGDFHHVGVWGGTKIAQIIKFFFLRPGFGTKQGQRRTSREPELSFTVCFDCEHVEETKCEVSIDRSMGAHGERSVYVAIGSLWVLAKKTGS